MAIVARAALELKVGTILTFGTEQTYEILAVEPRGERGVYLTLRRGDGYETHATEHDLDVAERVKPEAQVETETVKAASHAKAPVKPGATRRKRKAS